MKATGPPLLAIVAFAIIAVLCVFGPLASGAVASPVGSSASSNREKTVAPTADHVKVTVEHNFFDTETMCATTPTPIDEFIAKPESPIDPSHLRGRDLNSNRYADEPPVEMTSVMPGGDDHALRGVDLGH